MSRYSRLRQILKCELFLCLSFKDSFREMCFLKTTGIIILKGRSLETSKNFVEESVQTHGTTLEGREADGRVRGKENGGQFENLMRSLHGTTTAKHIKFSS